MKHISCHHTSVLRKTSDIWRVPVGNNDIRWVNKKKKQNFYYKTIGYAWCLLWNRKKKRGREINFPSFLPWSTPDKCFLFGENEDKHRSMPLCFLSILIKLINIQHLALLSTAVLSLIWIVFLPAYQQTTINHLSFCQKNMSTSMGPLSETGFDEGHESWLWRALSHFPDILPTQWQQSSTWSMSPFHLIVLPSLCHRHSYSDKRGRDDLLAPVIDKAHFSSTHTHSS